MSPVAYARLAWPLLLLVISAPIMMWVAISPLAGRFGDAYATYDSLAKLAGVVAAVLFCLNVILTSRLRWIEKLFGGLNKMYLAHHLIGCVALCVILLHPILFALRASTISSRDAALQLVPFATDTATTIGILSLATFITLMIITLYAKLPYRIWHWTHKLMGLVLLGVIVHVLLGSSDVAMSTPLRVYCWLLMGCAAIVFIYRTLLPRFMIYRFKYRITQTERLAPGVVRLVVKPLRRRLEFTAGQFVFVSFRGPQLSHEWHPFTISSNSAAEGLAIIVKDLGQYTGRVVAEISALVGQDIWLEGAYGGFSFAKFAAKKQVWVAGGIGITPFLSMAAEVTSDYHIDLYYSVKNKQEFVEWQYLLQASLKSGKHLRVIPVVTDTDGFLTAEKIAAQSGDLANADILICGPPPMMHALKSQLKALGVPKRRLHTEEFAIS